MPPSRRVVVQHYDTMSHNPARRVKATASRRLGVRSHRLSHPIVGPHKSGAELLLSGRCSIPYLPLIYPASCARMYFACANLANSAPLGVGSCRLLRCGRRCRSVFSAWLGIQRVTHIVHNLAAEVKHRGQTFRGIAPGRFSATCCAKRQATSAGRTSRGGRSEQDSRRTAPAVGETGRVVARVARTGADH